MHIQKYNETQILAACNLISFFIENYEPDFCELSIHNMDILTNYL